MVLNTNIQRYPPNPIAAGSTSTDQFVSLIGASCSTVSGRQTFASLCCHHGVNVITGDDTLLSAQGLCVCVCATSAAE